MFTPAEIVVVFLEGQHTITPSPNFDNLTP